MNLKQRTLLASLALAIVFLPACTEKPAPPAPTPNAAPPGPGQHFGKQNPREFPIYIYSDPAYPGQCFADWPQATLWKNNNQTVKWISDDGKDYFVDFTKPEAHNGSPFAQATFAVSANGVQPNGALSASSQKGKYYDYGIRLGTDANAPVCKKPDDPGLYVK
jgi:hypothetical protein